LVLEDPVTGEVLIGEFSRRNFNPASLETEADRSGNNKTLDRKLADSIYFVVKRENRVWQFPQGEAEDGKTLRQVSCDFCWESKPELPLFRQRKKL
jgi:hypothetical protein